MNELKILKCICGEKEKK